MIKFKTHKVLCTTVLDPDFLVVEEGEKREKKKERKETSGLLILCFNCSSNYSWETRVESKSDPLKTYFAAFI
jgi:hypothetical protein